MNKKLKKNIIEYGLFAVIILGIYFSGLHTEIIGFAQRGLLATGAMNPDIEQIQENSKTEEIAKTKADFSMKLINSKGENVSLEQYRGKVIFINFWATWCPPCIAEMPSIDKLHDEMGDEVAFVMLSLDQDFELAKAFNKRKGYNLPIYTLASNLPSMYESSAIPTTYVIDADGNLALTHKGMADYSDEEFKKFLKSLK